MYGHICEKHKSVTWQEEQWEIETTTVAHKDYGSRNPDQYLYGDSLSRRVGVAGIIYGAEAGTGPGVRADSNGDRSAESSGPFPQPLIWIAASTLFFLQVLQRQGAINTYCKLSDTEVHFSLWHCDNSVAQYKLLKKEL